MRVNELHKNDKLLRKSDFAYVKETGKKIIGKYLIAIIAPAKDGTLKCGVVCGKRYSKKAVERNRARRLLWESFRLTKRQIKKCHIILIPRQFMKGKKMNIVIEEFRRLLAKADMKIRKGKI